MIKVQTKLKMIVRRERPARSCTETETQWKVKWRAGIPCDLSKSQCRSASKHIARSVVPVGAVSNPIAHKSLPQLPHPYSHPSPHLKGQVVEQQMEEGNSIRQRQQLQAGVGKQRFDIVNVLNPSPSALRLGRRRTHVHGKHSRTLSVKPMVLLSWFMDWPIVSRKRCIPMLMGLREAGMQVSNSVQTIRQACRRAGEQLEQARRQAQAGKGRTESGFRSQPAACWYCCSAARASLSVSRFQSP